MPTIIKKGTNNSAFRLKNGRTIVIRTGFGGGDDLNILTERDFDDLMAEYGAFIKPRVLSDSNPNGCFIIHDRRDYAADMSREIGDEIKDNSAPIDLKIYRKKSKRK